MFNYVPSLHLNIRQDNDKVSLEYLVPGVAKENISVKVEGRKLVVSVKAADGVSSGFNQKEFSYIGQAVRAVTFREDIDVDATDVSLNNGILSIKVATKSSVNAKELQIQ